MEDFKIKCNNCDTYFLQLPNNHLSKKCNCPNCSSNKKKTTIDFIKKAKEIHEDKYDYSMVKYKNRNTKIKIICSEHGIFEQKPSNHIYNKNGCPKCGNRNKRLKTIKRIKKNKLNGNQLTPNFNLDACRLFDEIMNEKNIHIQHAKNGGEHHIKELGYWVDGFDKENNVVYEFDEKYHKYQTEKDLIRENEIKLFLKCEFIRIS